jgi:hypothetical protein
MNNLSLFMNGPAGIALGILLLALLAMRELAQVAAGPRWLALARALTIVATPILIIFLAAVVDLVIEAFR